METTDRDKKETPFTLSAIPCNKNLTRIESA